jgi:tetratricopeptide (TPR) repeat protein
LYAATAGIAARGAFNCGDADRARALAALAGGRVPGRGAARVAYPADVLADAALFEGDVARALEYWKGEVARARRDVDPIRQVHAVSALAVAQAVLGDPDAVLPDAREAVAVADATGNPTARSMAYFALGYLLKKSEPARALVLFDDAARLAGEVQNFWYFGIALMEAAATRAVHGDRATAARMFIEVLDQWERAGEWVEQWVSLRYITRLLAALGADDDALFLHCAVVRAGKRPPLREEQLRVLIDRVGADRFEAHRASATDGPEVVARARSVLQRCDERMAETTETSETTETTETAGVTVR